MKKLYKNRFAHKTHVVYEPNTRSYWEGSVFWTNIKNKAKRGTKHEMERVLRHELLQSFLRGARTEKI